MNDVVVKLLWTGGFDSTYRLCELVRQGIKVEPYYVFYKGRKSTPFELKAQKQILSFLSDKGYGNLILPVNYNQPDSFTIDRSILDCFFEVSKEHSLVTQTVLFSGFSKINKGIELSYEKRNNDFRHFVDKEMVFYKNDVGSYVMDKEKSSARAYLLFGDFSFPVLFKTNEEMYHSMIEWGFSKIFDLVHFCFSSHEEPCGVCSSCFNKLRDGLFDYRFSELAKKRFRVYFHLRKIDCNGKVPYSKYRYLLAFLYSYFIMNSFSYFMNIALSMKIETMEFNKLCMFFKQFDSFSLEEIDNYFVSHKTIFDILS